MTLWNYKCAILSSIFRGVLFFTTNLVAGFDAAVGAMVAEAGFRFVTSGFYGALTQAFRRVEPPFMGTLGAMVLLPALGHSMEFLLHSWRGTPELAASMGASIAFSVVSTAVTLAVMRRGYLLVGEKEEAR